ncbi:MAG: cytosine permease, partial [Pseudomonadota bacterium]|nr:cytosine permease [Pseudomonadota bacterium]
MSQSHDTVSACSANERNVGLISTIFLWLAGALVVPTVMTGQMFIPDVDPISAISIVFVGSVFGCIALASIAAIGTRTGLTTFVYARNVFGTSGAKAFAALNLVLLMGWGIIQGYLGGIALNKVLSIWFGFDHIVLSIIITQGIVLFVTMLGHSGIQKIEGWASGLMLILALAVIYYLLDMNGLTDLKEVPLSEEPGL